MTDEHAQLRSYAESRSEDGFASVVHRFLPLVFASALRRLNGDAHRAKDVTQLVFVALARNAGALSNHPDLTGWLFTTTRFLAAKALRTERRRQSREQEAHLILPEEGLPEVDSPRVHQLLDEVIAELKSIDRQLILLRFHRGLRLAQIGAELGVSENAVQKRLDRALEVLKEKLAQRNVTSTAAALALALDHQSAVAIPAGLAAASTHAGLACGAGAAGLFGISSFMTLSKLQIGIAVAVAIAGSAGFIWEHREANRLRATIEQENAAARQQAATLKKQIDTQSKRADSAEIDVTSLLRVLNVQSRPSAPIVPRVTSPMDFMKSATARADQFRRDGKFQEALDEYLQCYRALRTQRTSGVEAQLLMGGISSLGRTFSPAIAALRELRDTALQEFQDKPANRDAGREVALLNNRLGEGEHTIALYDALPSDSPLRQSFGMIAYDSFVQARRYSDALQGKTYGGMLTDLEMGIRVLEFDKTPSLVNVREALAQKVATNIEVLVGTGQHDEARALTNKLLAFDNSATTRALIDQHVARANEPPAR